MSTTGSDNDQLVSNTLWQSLLLIGISPTFAEGIKQLYNWRDKKENRI